MRALALLLVLWTGTAAAEGEVVRRFALLVGVNDGGPGRARLRYADTDARAFSQVLSELGGVSSADKVLLLEVGRAGLLDGFARVRRLAEGARASGARRVEVLLYYSGHSDDEGLLLQGERVDYGELRRALEGLPADVRIAVLDSCASGAFARRKGGVSRPAFLVDAGSQVKGHAILTSSSADESSQESDRLGGSFFTHHLVSGLRGAADVTHDGRVTLTEAYQFAFHETLARTERTQGGPQHPAYDIELAGTGDLVMTDLRATSAGLVLTEPLEGRLYVRDAAGNLVVEVQKTSGRLTELGLAPGRYTARRELAGAVAEAAFVLKENARTPLTPSDFTGVAGEATVRRGGPMTGAGGTAVGGPSMEPGATGAAGSRMRLPINLSLIPSLSTNAMRAGSAPVENRFALGGVNGGTALAGGVALSLVSNWYDAEAWGVQASLGANVTGGDVGGVQTALGANVARASVNGAQGALGLNYAGGDVRGFGQLSLGVNVARAALTGVQGALGVNYAGGELRGMQGALGVNHADGPVRGLQLSLGINSASGELRGVQASMGLNRAVNLTGAQVAFINVGGDVTGAQVGLINVGGVVRGLQLGIINVSEEVHGVPLGLLSFERKGQLHLELWSSDIALTNVAVKFGGKYFYTTLMAGLGPDDRLQRFSLGLGLGGHAVLSERVWMDLDLTVGTVYAVREAFEGDSGNVLTQARLMFGFQVVPRFAVFAGPTFNTWIVWGNPDFAKVTTVRVREHTNADGRLQYWPGFQVGVRI